MRALHPAALLALSLVAATSGPVAAGTELRDCAELGIDLTSLVTPLATNARAYYGRQVMLYKVDTIEPACCSAGIAVVLPDGASEVGGAKCVAAVGFGDVDVRRARSAYDPRRGLLVTLPTRLYDPETGLAGPGEPLRLRIELATSSVRRED